MRREQKRETARGKRNKQHSPTAFHYSPSQQCSDVKGEVNNERTMPGQNRH